MATVDGEIDTAKFTGYTAKLFQHEYDHMEGVDFRKRATRYHMEKAQKNMKLMTRKRKRVAA
jgi:peptide deformylase